MHEKFNVTLADANQPLSCTRAREIALSIIDGPGNPRPKLRKLNDESILTVDQIEKLFETVVNPAVFDVLYRSFPLSEAALEVMATVDRSLLRAASVWSRFKREYTPWLKSSVSLDAFGSLVMKLANDEKRLMFTLDERAATVGTLLNFWFDLNSMGFTGALTYFGSTSEITNLARSGILVYRNAYENEGREDLSSPIKTESTWYLLAAETISKLREASMLVARGSKRIPVISPRMLELFTRRFTPYATDSAAEAMINHQFETELCQAPRMALVAVLMSSYKRASPYELQGRAAAAFLRRCRLLQDDKTNPSDLSASIAISSWGWEAGLRATGRLVLPDDAVDDAVVREFLEVANWNGRPMGNTSVVLSLIEKLLSGVLPAPSLRFFMCQESHSSPFGENGRVRTRSELGQSYEISWIMLGRLLAVCLRMGCTGLQLLPEAFIRLLIKDGPVSAQVPSSTAEALYFVNTGARDVLGVLGFRVLSTSDFLSRFGLAEE